MKWNETTLEGKIRIKHGYAFKGEYFVQQGQHMVLTPGNFFETGGFRVREGKEKFYSGEIPQNYILSKGDLIVAMTEQGEGLLGSAAITPENDKYLHNQRIGLIQEDQKQVDRNFLYFLFNSFIVRQQIRNSCSGTKVRHTSPERIYRTRINLPPLEEQKKIAAILSAYDDLIENNKRRIALLENMAEEIYREWFVRFRFPGYQDAMPEKGIPKGWGKVTFASLCQFQKGKNPNQVLQSKEEDTSYYINMDTLNGNLNSFAKKQKNSIACNIGDILMLMDGSRSGSTFRSNVSGLVGSTLSVIRVDSLYKNFVYEYLNAMHEEIFSNNTGSAIPHANKDYINRMLLFIPSDESILSRFNDIYDENFAAIDNLTQQNGNLEKTKSRLLPRLISGKLSVEDLDIAFPPSMQENITR